MLAECPRGGTQRDGCVVSQTSSAVTFPHPPHHFRHAQRRQTGSETSQSRTANRAKASYRWSLEPPLSIGWELATAGRGRTAAESIL